MSSHSITQWRRMHVVRHFSLDNECSHMLVLGDKLVLTQGSNLLLITMDDERHVINTGFRVDSILHPVTYLNKVVITQGTQVKLFNI